MTINAKHRKHYKAGAVSPDLHRLKHPPRHLTRSRRWRGERVDITDAYQELGVNYGLANPADYPATTKKRSFAGRIFRAVKNLFKPNGSTRQR